MMKKPLLIFSFFFLSTVYCLLFTAVCFSQNLVPNFSFEEYDTCPNSEDQIQYATGWSKYSITTSTPDYYNACAPIGAGSLNVPNSGSSYQPAHRNCSAYAGVVTFFISITNYREQIGIQLSQPLTIGQKYFISFYTVMAGEKEFSDGYYEMPSNNIGIRLSTISYDGNNPCPIDNFAHINYPLILNDSINWTRVSGSIIADSAYDYLIVGNFFDDTNTDTLHYNCDSCLNYYSYYFVDDICLSTDSLLCNGGIDTLPCITSVNEIIFQDGVNVFPNPATDIITVSSQNNESVEILLYDVFGKIIYTNKIKNAGNININITPFSSGIYFLKIMNEVNQNSVIKKINKL